MTAPSLLLHRDVEALTHAVAARLVTRLVDAQSNGRVASVALTGGPMPADTAQGAEQAAVDYAAELAAAAPPGDRLPVPVFDLVMLGVGPDGHVASLFPEQPALYERDRTVVAVHGAPKPPPTRITLTMPVLSKTAEVWFVVSGEDKASAVRLALSGAGEMQIPAAGPKGRSRTLWLLDEAAGKDVPKNIRPPRI